MRRPGDNRKRTVIRSVCQEIRSEGEELSHIENMVVSLDYLLAELDLKASSHAQYLEKIDGVVDNISQQAVQLENEIDDEIEILIQALRRRKETLIKGLWQIVAKEDKVIGAKKAEIYESIKDLSAIRKEALANSLEFRQLFENAMEKHASLELDIDQSLEINFYANRQQLIDEIAQFGTVCIQSDQRKVLCSKSATAQGPMRRATRAVDAPFADDFDVLFKPEYVLNEKMAESSFEDSDFGTDEQPICELSGCCNCIDICEGQGKPLTSLQGYNSLEGRNLEAWLLKPNSATQFEGYGYAMDSYSSFSGNKLVDQLESLNLAQNKEYEGCKEQERFSSQFHQDPQFWLITKQRGLEACSLDEPNDAVVESSVSKIKKVWDEIMAMPPSYWLKTKSKTDVKPRNSERSSPNVSQFEEITCRPLMSWLKSCDKSDIVAGHMKSVEMEEKSQISKWLRKRHREDDVKDIETETVKMCNRIKNVPLTNWLKASQSEIREDKNMIYCNEASQITQRGKSSVSTAQQVEEIINIPLGQWLKDFKVPEKGLSNEWLLSPYSCEKITYPSCKESSVLRQFEEIAQSDLSLWIKRHGQPSMEPKHEFCKWLKHGALKDCKRCSFSCGDITEVI